MSPLDDLAVTRVRNLRLQYALAVFGPGIVVMLADTDVGSIITAANSGVQFGYRMLAQQLLLVPVLFIVQELTVRLGIFTGRGHGELIRERFGRVWAWVLGGGPGHCHGRRAADRIRRRRRCGRDSTACRAASASPWRRPAPCWRSC